MSKSNCLKVLVVDDTITYRNILKSALADIDDVKVIGTAPNGYIALGKIKQCHPDMVLLDLEMPEMNGLEALEEIKKRYPQIGVVMISGTNLSSMENTIKALELGALDFIKKPEGNDVNANISYIRDYLKPIIKAFEITYTSKIPVKTEEQPEIKSGEFHERVKPDHYDLVAIGCSTGGPIALMKLLPKLSSSLSVPTIIVQHMPKGFTASFSKNLDAKSKLKIVEAHGEEDLKSGCVYIAPGGKHLLVKRNKIGNYVTVLSNTPSENNCKPSVDIMLRSLAESFEGNVLIVILTGMGSDGMKGVEALKKRGGCYCITQSEQSCVVYGMPRVVDEAGLSDSSLSLDVIGSKITELIGGKRNVSNYI